MTKNTEFKISHVPYTHTGSTFLLEYPNTDRQTESEAHSPHYEQTVRIWIFVDSEKPVSKYPGTGGMGFRFYLHFLSSMLLCLNSFILFHSILLFFSFSVPTAICPNDSLLGFKWCLAKKLLT